MDPVSNVDRLVLILRQRLEGRATRGAAATGKAPGSATEAVDKASNLRALAALDGVDDETLARALIEGILTDALGGELLNDAKFQQVVDRVGQAIRQDERARALLSDLVLAVRRDGRTTG